MAARGARAAAADAGDRVPKQPIARRIGEQTIPLVFSAALDPDRIGLVASLNRRHRTSFFRVGCQMHQRLLDGFGFQQLLLCHDSVTHSRPSLPVV